MCCTGCLDLSMVSVPMQMYTRYAGLLYGPISVCDLMTGLMELSYCGWHVLWNPLNYHVVLICLYIKRKGSQNVNIANIRDKHY